MKPEIKQQWLDALRSGQYKKTVGALRRGDRYCVLGVLFDLHAKAQPEIAHWDAWRLREQVAAVTLDSDETPNYCHYSLPDETAAWAGLDDYMVPIRVGDQITDLGSWNDGLPGIREPLSFEELARLIEAQL